MVNGNCFERLERRQNWHAFLKK